MKTIPNSITELRKFVSDHMNDMSRLLCLNNYPRGCSTLHKNKSKLVRIIDNRMRKNDASVKRQSEKISKSFLVISPKGVKYSGSNLKDFCVRKKLHQGKMSQVCRGGCSHYKGWKGEYT
jgi:hypothetical protein